MVSAESGSLPHRTQLRYSLLGLDRAPEDDADDATELHAAGNRFTELHWMRPFRNLRILDLRHNLLRGVAGIEVCAATLVELELRDNRIADGALLVTELVPLYGLVKLDARYNPFCAGFYDESIALSPPPAAVKSSLKNRPTSAKMGQLPT